ncbi:aspartate--tRNA ligase [Microbacter margulisiae]|uniref:Aspartate--tRNA ligase n=1 Tax=Microbacter margulisiae TaxID=1350067 RepID=A0A7W5H1B1_9PORP|nr:aspartate--tRNA ligase [Microbacter margulisiae]MBB3186454.1 aspartyl-tRNA synthetase [Microbacter margulisiae]
MYRTHTCGELRLQNVNESVILSGWVQRIRKMGGMTFVDLRDRFGITQLVFDQEKNPKLFEKANRLGREWVIQCQGIVAERSNKNLHLNTGEIEIIAAELSILNESKIPPFTIEDDTDGGDDLRMEYRYIDLRRNTVRKNLELRHLIALEVRKYLSEHNFLEVETPVLIKSTPEGARDFVVPSRMNPGEFYALPQSPQLYKQLLMVAGFDRYFQIVKCFRDEDLRADRQPEFTQIDCEMSFVMQDDVLDLFEGMMIHLFKTIHHIDIHDFPRMTYADAMRLYGSDKPDLRFGMPFVELKEVVSGHQFSVFDSAEYVGGICATGCSSYTRKQIDELTEFVKRPQLGAKGLVYIKYEPDGSFKSSIDKFYNANDLETIAEEVQAKPGDLILILADEKKKAQKVLSELRLEMGTRLGLRKKDVFAPLWVVDFPLFEWDEETQRYYAMHHAFTSPKPEDIVLLSTDPGQVRANAYDMVINGVELGGGSIRIHNSELQHKIFQIMGFSEEEAQFKFGFLMDAFKYGAPPHGGLAFGLDRVVSLFAGLDSIRDCIAFPKNNAGRDMMSGAPSPIETNQLTELSLKLIDSK